VRSVLDDLLLREEHLRLSGAADDLARPGTDLDEDLHGSAVVDIG
jgi:hypothetical protein